MIASEGDVFNDYDSSELAKILIQNGADVNITDKVNKLYGIVLN